MRKWYVECACFLQDDRNINFRLYKLTTHVEILRVTSVKKEIKYLSLKIAEGEKVIRKTQNQI